MQVAKAGALLLIAGFVVACGESATDLDESLTPAFHKGGQSSKSTKSSKSSKSPPAPSAAILLGTTGRSGTLSTLIEIDPVTGATLRTIGPVGFAVNGMEFDPTTGTLFASTSVLDPAYNGLITIDQTTGAGTPVSTTSGFGLGTSEVINNITVNASGQLWGWWQPAEDDLVLIDKTTGTGTVLEAGIVQNVRNGSLDFDNSDVLYVTSFAPASVWVVDPVLSSATLQGTLTPPTPDPFFITHHGDFHPGTNVFYALTDQFSPANLLEIDIATLTVTSTVPLADDAHVITWVGGGQAPDCPKSAKSSKSGKSAKSTKC